MSIRSLRLPRLVESTPHGAQLLSDLLSHSRPIRAGSEVSVATAHLAGLEDALWSAHRAGRVVRGFEAAEKTLSAEERGLRSVDETTGVKRGSRVSRLLLLANDGSDGFYRRIENLIRSHHPRVLAVRLDVDAATLGAPLYGAGSNTRLLMIQHKVAVAAVLLDIAAQYR